MQRQEALYLDGLREEAEVGTHTNIHTHLCSKEKTQMMCSKQPTQLPDTRDRSVGEPAGRLKYCECGLDWQLHGDR